MTIPEPATAPTEPSESRVLLIDCLLRFRLAPAQIQEAMHFADAYAAHMIEAYARPDDRWGPQ